MFRNSGSGSSTTENWNWKIEKRRNIMWNHEAGSVTGAEQNSCRLLLQPRLRNSKLLTQPREREREDGEKEFQVCSHKYIQ